MAPQRLDRIKGVAAVEGVVREEAALLQVEAAVLNTPPESVQRGHIHKNNQLKRKKQKS
jgi:hypothetical protein